MRSRWISRALLAGIAAVAVLGVVFALRTLMAQSNASSTAVIDDLVVANRILAHEIGVLDAYGHVSVRDPRNPNHYYLSRAISAGMVTAADIIEYDLDSKSVGRDRSDGYLERFIHGEVYKARPDVMAVIHAHSPELIAFGASSVPLRNMIHVGSFINDGVPIFDVRKFGGTADDMLIRNPALGKALAQALGNKTAMILFGHGVVVTAASLPTVVSNAYFLNMNARVEEQAIRLGGTVSYLDREPGAKRPPVTPAGAAANNRAWEYWKRQVTTK
ncbi:MAG TPA: class II aldolase/adducin family protein [Bryobacteraceae bacterium]|nr:class II aldolase/adducin family protein [Bryobacteraceae bacterium]